MATFRTISEAAERNKEPIYQVLRDYIPKEGTVLEIACGSGQHALYYSEKFPKNKWLPTDKDEESISQIKKIWEENPNGNLQEPQVLNVLSESWPISEAEMVFNLNMIHIAPFEAVNALFKGSAKVLKKGSRLYIYGPFLIEGTPTAPSNISFDEFLRKKDPRFGVRQLEDVIEIAKRNGFELENKIEMPANNLSLIFTVSQ